MDVCPFRRGVASSETELICFPEGRLVTLEQSRGAGSCRGPRQGDLERGGDCSAGLRGVRMGRTLHLGRGLGFFESFPFLRIGKRLLIFVGPFADMCFCVLRVGPLVRVLLIMVGTRQFL